VKALVSVRAILPALLVLLAGLAVGFVFWNRADPPARAGTKLYALPATPASKVELSGPTVTRLDPGTVRCRFEYRFVEGQPAPGSWYCCLVEFEGSPGSYRRPIEAKDLRAKGTLEHEVRLIRPGAKSFQIYLADALERQGPYRQVSNVVMGPVTD
jgi:hypothetical protein